VSGGQTGHDLESVEPLPLEARDDLVRVALLVGRPVLDAVEDVDGASARGVPAEDLAVHGREVDDGHREGAVHVEHHPAQRPPRPGGGRWRGGGGGRHGPAAGEGAAAGERRGARGEGAAEEQAVGPEEHAGEHAWRDLGRWMGPYREAAVGFMGLRLIGAACGWCWPGWSVSQWWAFAVSMLPPPLHCICFFF